MKIIRASEISPEKRDDGRTILKLYNYDFDKKPGNINFLVSEIPKHVIEQKHYHTDSDEIFYFLTKGKININSKDYSFNAGDMVILSRNDKHQVITENYTTKLLAIKVPNISDKVSC